MSLLDAVEMPVYSFENFQFDTDRWQLLRDRLPVRIAPQACEVLELLISKQGEPIQRSEIEKVLWPNGEKGTPETADALLSTIIMKLRKAMKDQEAHRLIRTVTEKNFSGYAFGVPVAIEQPARPAPSAHSNPASQPSNPAGATEPPAPVGILPEEKPDIRRMALHFALLAIGLACFAFAASKGTYGISIPILWLCCLPLLPFVRQSPIARGFEALLLTTALAYSPSAATLGQVMASVVNITTIEPAIIYPAVTGLKFVPLFLLVLAHWALAGWLKGDVLSAAAYWVSGISLLIVTAAAGTISSGDMVIWQQALPGYITLSVCYGIIALLNLAALAAGFLVFRGRVGWGTGLVACALAYLLLAVFAFVVGTEYNSINSRSLDKRRTQAYAPRNLKPIEDPASRSAWADRIGPDLATLLDDQRFKTALRTGRFYRQDFDEPFQVLDKAIMLGTRLDPDAKHPHFTVVRFPRGLADAMQFVPVSE